MEEGKKGKERLWKELIINTDCCNLQQNILSIVIKCQSSWEPKFLAHHIRLLVPEGLITEGAPASIEVHLYCSTASVTCDLDGAQPHSPFIQGD